ncbi:MAG TPA: methyltransferase domain-containing protein [Candidatus Binatia bacterium]|jgi:SAM-dependent methyltransferase
MWSKKCSKVAEIKNGDILYDMGSGDGRVVIEAAKKYGIRAVGVDLNPELVAKARENAMKEGVGHLVEFRAQDGADRRYFRSNRGDAVQMVQQRAAPETAGSRVIAHDFDIDDWQPSRIEYVRPPGDGSDYAESRTLYIWIVGLTPTSN